MIHGPTNEHFPLTCMAIDMTSPNETTLTKGDTFFWSLSTPYASGNELFIREASSVHIMVLISNGELLTTKMMCNRATERPLLNRAVRPLRLSVRYFSAILAVAIVSGLL